MSEKFKSLEHPGIDITREFKASPEVVFTSWIEPAQFSIWWGGEGTEVPLESVIMDVSVGGTWGALMILPDGNTIDWYGEYVEIAKFTKLVLTLADRPGDEREIVHVEFAPTADGCQMRTRQWGGHMDDDGYAQATAGYNTFLDTMQAIVEAA